MQNVHLRRQFIQQIRIARIEVTRSKCFMPSMISLDPGAASFLSAQPLKMYIGGKWVEAKSGKTFETFDPGSGEAVASVPAGDAADVNAAVAAAQEAFRKSGWATMP